MDEIRIKEDMIKAYKQYLLSIPKGEERNSRSAIIVHTSDLSNYYWLEYGVDATLVGRINKSTGEFTEVCGADIGSWDVALYGEMRKIHMECEVEE